MQNKQVVFSAIIVEKEIKHIQQLTELIKQGFPDIKVISSHDNAREAMQNIIEHNPDLVFVDIDMPLISGAELLRQVPKINFDVIFTANDDDSKLKNLELNLANLLLKPYSKVPLLLAIEKFKQSREGFGNSGNSALRLLLKKIIGSPHRKIAIPVKNSMVFLETADILYLESDRNYTKIYMKDGRVITATKTLGHFEKLLASNEFSRVHASFLVNSHEISEFRKVDSGELVISNGKVIKVSRNKKGNLNFLS
ncbi:MAG: hypothetical protein RI973_1909 [Bacteroidota bacterium]|jgi:two-component system LytT family response regulator